MRPSGLQVKVTLAIVLSLLVIDGVGAAVAEFNFRESEMTHARDLGQDRVDALQQVLDLRFHALGQVAADVAETVSKRSEDDLAQSMRRGGYTASIIFGPEGILWKGGDARYNRTLEEMMLTAPPGPGIPGRVFHLKEGWLVVGVRALNQKYAVAGAIDRDTLTNSFLTDALIEAEGANVIVSKEGRPVAASPTFTTGGDLAALEGATSFVMEDGEYIVVQKPLTSIQGRVAHLVPVAGIEARVDALVFRFVATSTAAVALAGIATVIIVAYALRPLRRITDAARRLGAGEENLDLRVRSRDEMGVLADVLNQSARAIGEARRAQEEHARELRLAAEDFQVAVGALARNVGEADTAPEIALRVAEAVLHVTPSRAVAVYQGDTLLELRVAPNADVDDHAVRALLQSDADAFRWLTHRTDDEHVRLALLGEAGAQVVDGDGRKAEILLHQAALAFHRARSMDSLRQAHATLDDLVRQKQMFVDILSHDLKNPIAVARGRVEMLARKEPPIAPRCEPVLQSLDRATRIIEEAVLFSKLEREQGVESTEIDLATLAADAVHALRPLADARSIEIASSAPATVPWRASPLLQRAIENLLSNAIKWSPERASVLVDVEPTATACRIRVIDHGPGIPPEDRARLFARFERADRTGVKGTGLGLAIAKRVVDMHQGTITIETTPGGGCTFVLTIPARAATPANPHPTPVPSEGSA